MQIKSLSSDPKEWVDGKLPEPGQKVEIVCVEVRHEPAGLKDSVAIVELKFKAC